MSHRLALVLASLLFAGPLQAQEPIVGLPCEGCEAVFEGMPQQLHSRARIGQPDEPGRAMLVTGSVLGSDGRPSRGIVVYAYQTNNNGIYPTTDKTLGKASHRHGMLRAWAMTNAHGRYAFDTIRPAGYPNTDLPAHIHMHVIERGCSTYYIDDIMFKDDPRLTEDSLRKLTQGRGGRGVVQPKLYNGTWYVKRDIALGKNIPGYSTCKPKRPAT